ncbi:GNAT family N-acetyltransferase [Paracoccus laeviglucosivorans]|uniref:Acetyltransferase (GNAT) family protein n=1 Tax=Paracoccus laeviglucosivorans TaxID=1197861 RepID=A0A521E0Z0_9RHOB|nr:GNAT family N-acetyltransferase [Paracoccus laeviglucosivorans]SMO76790.1 Acetyltransferase (GNAT) family protein [Paracoccus laeviglucosivorans]
MPITIRIDQGVPPHLQGAAARLYWRGFGAALQPMPTRPRQGVALVAALMQPGRALIALGPQGGLVGIAGLRGVEGGFLGDGTGGFVAAFGPARGRLRHLATHLHRGGVTTDDMILDGLVVRAGWRGRGIARALVDAAASQAGRLGHPALLAEVMADNPEALAAWQAMGFQPIGRQRQGWPWHAPAHLLRRAL